MLQVALSLILLLASITGINRPISPVLLNLSQTRSGEIVTNFSHNIGSRLPDWYWGEVIAWNSGFSDPTATAANDWRDSPEHWAILSNPYYRFIGCGVIESGARWYFDCIVGTPAVVVAAPTPAPTIVLPDTAMRGGS